MINYLALAEWLLDLAENTDVSASYRDRSIARRLARIATARHDLQELLASPKK